MLEWATGYFKKREIPDPRLSIEWLLAEVLGVKRLDLYLKYDRPLSPDELNELRSLVKRRAEHEPLQYILGFSDFMNCRIHVDQRVLIPRVETEQLVEIVLHDLENRKDESLDVLDIGTGSGCIPIAIKKARPKWNCTGIDISEEVLELARNNATENDTSVRFMKGDLFLLDQLNEFENEPFDLIISNPPYITPEEKNSLEPQVIRYEPESALFYENPSEVYKSIIDFADDKLTHGGSLYLECNAILTERIKKILEKKLDKVEILKDYDGKKRFLTAVKTF